MDLGISGGLDRIFLHLRVPHIWPAALLLLMEVQRGDRGEGRVKVVYSGARDKVLQSCAAVLWFLVFFSVQLV